MDRTEEGNQTISLQVTEYLLEAAKVTGRKEHTELQKVLHEWLLQGAQEAVLQAIEDAELTYLQAAHALQITLYDLQELLVARGEYPGIEHDDYGIVRQNIQLKKKSAN